MPLFKIDRKHIVAAADNAAARTTLANAKNLTPEEVADLEVLRYLDDTDVTLLVEGEQVTKAAAEWVAEKGVGVLASADW